MNSIVVLQRGTHMQATHLPSGHRSLSGSSSILPSQSSSLQLQVSGCGPTSPSHCSLPDTQRSLPGMHSPSSVPHASPAAVSSSILPSQSLSSPSQVSSGELHCPHALRRPSSTMPSQSSSSPSHIVSGGSSHSSIAGMPAGLLQNLEMPSSTLPSQSSSLLLQVSCGGCASAMILLSAADSSASLAAGK